MIRRNLVPDPYVQTDSWRTILMGGTIDEVTDTPANIGYTWNDDPIIPVRGGMRYGFVFDIDVIDRPVGGLLRGIIVWINDDDSITDSWFGVDKPVGLHTDDRVIVTAPDNAVAARPSVLFMSTADAEDATGPLDFTFTNVLLEPLGLPVAQNVNAVENMVTDGSLTYGGLGWVDHTDGCIDPIHEVDTVWADTGDSSMHSAGTSDVVTLPNGLKGFIGNYILPFNEVGYPCVPGDIIRFGSTINIVSAPDVGDPDIDSGEPGAFQEIFFYFYDGDPTHTIQVAQNNGPTAFKQDVLGVRHLTMEAVCPDGANVAQVTTVMATVTAGKDMEMRTDSAIVVKNKALPDYFDGDTERSSSLYPAWSGIPGKSTSFNPGIPSRVPGPFVEIGTNGWEWDGPENAAISCQPQNLHLISHANPNVA